MSETINMEMNGAVMHISVTATQSLRSILQAKNLDPNQFILIVNGQPASPDQEIHENDNIIIIPRVKGGIQ